MDRKFPYLKIIIFALALAAAAFVNGMLLPREFSEKIILLLMEYIGGIKFTFSGIFLNNLTASAILFAGGFILALPSLLSYYFNFLALGAVFAMSIRTIGMTKFFLSIAPHGIFEIPAIIISFILGISVVYSLFQSTVLKRDMDFKRRFMIWARIFLAVVIPLLILAAIIEVNLTPWLLKNI